VEEYASSYQGAAFVVHIVEMSKDLHGSEKRYYQINKDANVEKLSVFLPQSTPSLHLDCQRQMEFVHIGTIST
jgi:hypothetical protein